MDRPMVLRKLAASLLLGSLGFLANWFKLEIFFNVDFLFGSFFVMLAIQMIGAGYGLLAGFMAALCTYLLWSHPWAVVIMTGEAAVVGFLHSRRKGNLVAYDTLYWLFLGLPLIYLFYHHFMGVQLQPTLLIMLKQPINGIFNTLMAYLIVILFRLRKKATKISVPYSQVIFVAMVSLVLLPSLALLIAGMRIYLNLSIKQLAAKVSTTGEIAQNSIDDWISDHLKTVKTLSALVGDPDQIPFEKMQHYVETVKAASPGFFRMGVFNEKAISVAYCPLTDENGKSNLGVDFSDRPYIAVMRREKQPFISDVVMGKLGNPIPIVLLLAPMIMNNRYQGYSSGVLETSHLSEILNRLTGKDHISLTLVDGNGKVIAGTTPGLKIMAPFIRPFLQAGPLQVFDTRHWIPAPQSGTSVMQRWRDSILVKAVDLSPVSGWKLVVEVPFLPQLEQISRYSIIGLSLLALLTLLTVGLSHWFSTAMVSTIITLQETTRTLPERMGRSREIEWPQSKITELEELSRNFRDISLALMKSIQQQRSLNASLEQRIQERTKELEEREGFIRDVLDSLTAHVAVLDHEGNILIVNESWRRFARENGGTEETLGVGLNYFAICEKALLSGGNEEIARILAGLREVMEGTRKQFSREYDCHSPEEQRWFTLQCSPLSGPQQGVVVAHENSTARVRAENLLRENEEKYRKLFENDLNAICIYDSDTLRFIDVNEAHVRLYGYSRQELLDRCTLHDISSEPEATAEAIRQARSGETIIVPLRYHQKKDGTVFPVEIVVGPYLLRDRPVIFAIARDITERQRAEEAIKGYTIKLRESNQALKDFVFIASHDLQEPLRKVRTFGHMLTEKGGALLDEQGKDYLWRMIAAAGHMHSLLTALLEYSRLSTRALSSETVDLNALLQEVCSDLELTIQQSGGQITSGTLPVIKADPVQIRLLLQNLISNGLKFHQAGQHPEVKISGTVSQDHWVRIEVSDKGIGFQEEFREKIFDPFLRLHGKSSPYKGTGMGLTICKKIVDRHGGRITARSRPGEGSTFIIELPATDKNG